MSGLSDAFGDVPGRPDLERWWTKVFVQENDCWPWTGRVNDGGYGGFDVDGRSVLAHRWGYTQLVGPVEPHEVVRHTCDNPPCCRLDHWLKGTRADNAQDMLERGRRAPTHGEKNPRAKLTAHTVNEVRRMYSCGNFSQAALGEMFGVSQVQISHIVRGLQWTR